jgi:hypothetical protein
VGRDEGRGLFEGEGQAAESGGQRRRCRPLIAVASIAPGSCKQKRHGLIRRHLDYI